MEISPKSSIDGFFGVSTIYGNPHRSTNLSGTAPPTLVAKNILEHRHTEHRIRPFGFQTMRGVVSIFFAQEKARNGGLWSFLTWNIFDIKKLSSITWQSLVDTHWLISKRYSSEVLEPNPSVAVMVHYEVRVGCLRVRERPIFSVWVRDLLTAKSSKIRLTIRHPISIQWLWGS